MAKVPGDCWLHKTPMAEARGKKGPYWFCEACRAENMAFSAKRREAAEQDARDQRVADALRVKGTDLKLERLGIDPDELIWWIKRRLEE